MSVSSVSSDPTVYQNSASRPFQQVRKDFAALGKALNSGSSDALTTAQSAFQKLQSDLVQMQQVQLQQTQSGQQTGANSQFSTDLAALEKAVQSGDLSGAQKAFAALQSDLLQVRQVPQTQNGQQTQSVQQTQEAHHHHGGSAQNAQNTTSNPFSDLAAIGSALQSGNLSDAQSAFATLQQDMGNSSGQSTTATSGTDLTSLSSALQSGNLSDAQSAFATLMQNLQNSIGTLGGSAIGASIDVAA